MKRALQIIFPFIGFLSLGCAEGSLESAGANGEESVTDEDYAVTTFNALTTNALTTNALTTNALTTNALTTNALTTNALTTNALTTNGITTGSLHPLLLPALQDPGPSGDNTREFFQYLVGCALDSTQIVEFSWTDTGGVVHNESMAGGVGLAPNWLTNGALSESSQHWISACIAARTNWYGVTVLISMRGPHLDLKHIAAGELTEYPVLEGGFWGNLFGATPEIYACHDSADMADARARSRDCAAGHLAPDGSVQNCGNIAIAGSCEDLCKKMHKPGQYLKTCGVDGSHQKNETVTVWLHQ